MADVMSGPVTVVGVHGVGNHQAALGPVAAADRIAGWWHNALLAGLQRPHEESGLQVRMAYYADHLRTRTPQGPEELDALDKAAQARVIAWARLLGADEPTVQGWVTAPVRAAISWVANRYGLDHGAVRALVARFFGEVETYFTEPGRRERARIRVAEAITAVHPQVVIAHSLGSVVTYETLWAHELPPIDLLITLGSPLAMPDIVHDRLVPHEGLRRRPPGIGTWINIADPGDIIAIPARGIPARFAGVAADRTNAIGAFDFHRAVRYLKNSATADALTAHL
ncbi:hypothetical protein SAMN04489712_14514 [Thermomonospora echinospora]|uniref:Serine peptidase n=1 Tax=Thermomonospora echinospora TaxID=1992 RepID=A0A1H6E996_9ACTN|nr:serine peptidase [Thermomonospora echinospora]SEG94287.1 hypothetical protein SAMN04489712_14514 [Thermomonospora echinospora]